jgi:hypothetical protein
VRLSPQLVKDYAGWYELSDGTALEIRPEGRYFVARTGVREGLLQPKSDTEFSFGSTIFRFSGSGASAVTSVEVVQNGQVRNKGRKLEPNAKEKP